MGARGKLFLLSVLLVIVNFEDIRGEGTQCPESNEGLAVHLPHETNCSLFYHCDLGVPVLKECPDGLHFNQILEVCDWPERAGCQRGGSGESEDSNGGSDGEGNNDGNNEGNSGSNGGIECPVDNEGNAVHLPHESNCSLFYQCDWGVAVLKECPASLHFNPVLQVCDWPDDAGCQSGGGDDGNDGDNGDGGNGDNSDGDGEGVNDGSSNGDNDGGEGDGDNDGSGNGGNDSDEGDGDSDSSGGSNGGSECPADNEGDAVHLPHESNCSLFYQCDWGVAVLKECPASLHFNPVLQVCDWPDDAGCQSGGGNDGSIGDEGSSDVDDGDNGDGNSGGDDSDGVDNSDNGDSSSEAPSTEDGSGVCNSVNCPEENEEYVTFIPNTQDCTRFCKCNWGLAYEFVCPAGLFLNPTLNVCDYPERAGCNSP